MNNKNIIPIKSLRIYKKVPTSSTHLKAQEPYNIDWNMDKKKKKNFKGKENLERIYIKHSHYNQSISPYGPIINPNPTPK